MSGKIKNNTIIGLVGGVFLLLCIMVWFTPDSERSVSERRELKQMPELTWESVLSGRFMSNFEDYSLDQFPFRDTFRSFKALTALKSDNNDIYVADGVINSMDYPLNEDKLSYASNRFLNVYNMYLKDAGCRLFFSIIPDKNYFYAEENGYLAIDYDKLVNQMTAENDYMTYLDIFPYLAGESYYRTDTHWRQECLDEVADILLAGMGNPVETEYEEVQAEGDFYGVYYGQAALPFEPDKINYLTNAVIEGFEVYDYGNGKAIPVYDESQMGEDDPYELFLGGPSSLVTIDNPACDTGRHLIVFRDSFGSSLSPLLAQGYSKTTLIDIRYIQPAMLKNFVDFTDADVLFIYSTMVLNNSDTLK